MIDDQYLADAILAMAKLSPGERATVISVVDRMRFTVAEVLAEPEVQPETRRQVKRKATARPESDRQNYTDQEAVIFDAAAKDWGPKPAAVRREVIGRLSTQMGRTQDAIKYQITSRLK